MHFNKQNGVKNSYLITKAKSQIGADFLRSIVVIVISTMMILRLYGSGTFGSNLLRALLGLKGTTEPRKVIYFLESSCL